MPRVIHHQPPDVRSPQTPRFGTKFMAEALWPGDAARLLARRAAGQLTVPRGDGRPVVLLPGYLAPEWSMGALRRFLASTGYAAQHWRLGRNMGDPESDAQRVLDLIRAGAYGTTQPVPLVGWSLGGVVAREVARLAPDAVEQVITLGSPVVGGPTHTVFANKWEPAHREAIASKIDELNRSRPLAVPLTAVFSRRDGIVDFAASIDPFALNAVHVEVSCTHFGLGLDPDVWQTTAEALASEGPFRNR